MKPLRPAALRRATCLLLGAAIVVSSLVAAKSVEAQGAPPNTPPPVTVAKPVVKDIREWDEFIGRFEAVDEVEIRARVSGYLDKVHFQRWRDRQSRRSPLHDRPAAIPGTTLRKPRPRSPLLKRVSSSPPADLERAEALRRTGNIPEQLFDQRRQALLTARADFDRAQATLNRARLDMEFTQITRPSGGPRLAASSSPRATSSTRTRRC